MKRRCEWCGCFVPNQQPRTARYYYDINHDLPVAVYSLATAVRFHTPLLCRFCARYAHCCRMREAERDHGTAIGVSLPNGWEPVAHEVTQADYMGAGGTLAVTLHERVPVTVS